MKFGWGRWGTGWQIVVQMGWSRGNEGKRAVLSV